MDIRQINSATLGPFKWEDYMRRHFMNDTIGLARVRRVLTVLVAIPFAAAAIWLAWAFA